MAKKDVAQQLFDVQARGCAPGLRDVVDRSTQQKVQEDDQRFAFGDDWIQMQRGGTPSVPAVDAAGEAKLDVLSDVVVAGCEKTSASATMIAEMMMSGLRKRVPPKNTRAARCGSDQY